MFTPKDIIALGIPGGPHIPAMVAHANATGVCTYDHLSPLLPPPAVSLRNPLKIGVNIHAETDDECANVDAVIATMTELTRTPVIEAAAIMPDACPAGSMGTIPVGGVVASKHVHPGMHSADICCSVMVSTFDHLGPDELLDRVCAKTHFGPGGRADHVMRGGLRDFVYGNRFTRDFEHVGDWHMGTQGDGNHFSYVGIQKSTGKTTLVTHHGSRGFGARVYKAGMAVAEKYRRKLSPETLKQNAWIPNDTQDFADYMDALDIVKRWTCDNHAILHDDGDCVTWTIHNFVFERDGVLYHGKGATPAWGDGVEAIPLNMAQPVLLARGLDNPGALGFCPHGAGRNFSRSEHMRRGGSDIEAETDGLDVRFWTGKPDQSELPSAYKDAASVRRDIEGYGLARVVDEIVPYGCIMAGEIEQPWLKKVVDDL